MVFRVVTWIITVIIGAVRALCPRCAKTPPMSLLRCSLERPNSVIPVEWSGHSRCEAIRRRPFGTSAAGCADATVAISDGERHGAADELAPRHPRHHIGWALCRHTDAVKKATDLDSGHAVSRGRLSRRGCAGVEAEFSGSRNGHDVRSPVQGLKNVGRCHFRALSTTRFSPRPISVRLLPGCLPQGNVYGTNQRGRTVHCARAVRRLGPFPPCAPIRQHCRRCVQCGACMGTNGHGKRGAPANGRSPVRRCQNDSPDATHATDTSNTCQYRWPMDRTRWEAAPMNTVTRTRFSQVDPRPSHGWPLSRVSANGDRCP